MPRHAITCSGSNSAIWFAFNAAPFNSWSAATNIEIEWPDGSLRSLRMRPTRTSSWPEASNRVSGNGSGPIARSADAGPHRRQQFRIVRHFGLHQSVFLAKWGTGSLSKKTRQNNKPIKKPRTFSGGASGSDDAIASSMRARLPKPARACRFSWWFSRSSSWERQHIDRAERRQPLKSFAISVRAGSTRLKRRRLLRDKLPHEPSR